MTENSTSTISKIANDLKKWLDSLSDFNDYKELRRWLKGHPLPPVGYDEEPYVWIQRGLKTLPALYLKQFTHLIINFLKEEKPHLNPSPLNSDKLLFNLFSYCSECGLPKTTAKSIFEVFEDSISERNFRDFLLIQRVYNIKRAVGEAFYSNTFALDELGKNLKRRAEELSYDKNREEKFHELVMHIQKVWLDYPNWSEVMSEQAVKNDFPAWVADKILCYPIQFSPVESDRTIRYDVWSIIPESLVVIDNNFNIISENGFFSTVEFPVHNKPTVNFLNEILYKTESIRKKLNEKTYSYQLKAISEELLHLESDLKIKGEDGYASVVSNIKGYLRVFVQPERAKAQTEKLYRVAM